MVAKKRKAPATELKQSKPAAFDVSALAAVGLAADRPKALDVRAQSLLLQEAFEKPDQVEVDTPTSTPPAGGSIVARFGWRTFKSVIGLGIIVVAGVGPVQRLLEFSSIEAVVNARLVSLRAPIDGRIEEADFAPGIGATAPKGRLMLRISNQRADRGRLDDLQRLVDQAESERPILAQRLRRLKEIHDGISKQARVSSGTYQGARRAHDGPEGAGCRD